MMSVMSVIPLLHYARVRVRARQLPDSCRRDEEGWEAYG
jgi:hypothetical protein